jgi:hypothetical protein
MVIDEWMSNRHWELAWTSNNCCRRSRWQPTVNEEHFQHHYLLLYAVWFIIFVLCFVVVVVVVMHCCCCCCCCCSFSNQSLVECDTFDWQTKRKDFCNTRVAYWCFSIYCHDEWHFLCTKIGVYAVRVQSTIDRIMIPKYDCLHRLFLLILVFVLTMMFRFYNKRHRLPVVFILIRRPEWENLHYRNFSW